MGCGKNNARQEYMIGLIDAGINAPSEEAFMVDEQADVDAMLDDEIGEFVT